jgi:hypothetical protein
MIQLLYSQNYSILIQICQGGKIPKSYYFKKTNNTGPPEDNFTITVIKKGGKLCLPFIAAAENSILK